MRKLVSVATLALNFALAAWWVWREILAFEEFRVDRPGAGVLAFMADRSPFYLAGVLAAVAVFAVAIWLDRLPATGADITEFHEKEAR
ncbi:MAG: hypothetical protein ACK4VY_00090 [Brevundimonas sp.]